MDDCKNCEFLEKCREEERRKRGGRGTGET